MPAPLRPPAVLRSRPFALLWTSRTIATFGSAMTFIVLPLAIYDMTGSALLLAASLGGQTLAVILLSMLGGLIADRFCRRRTIVVADLARAAVLLGLVAVTADRIWLAIACATAATAAATLMKPAYAAIVPELVPPEELQQAHMLNGLVSTLSGTVTPIVGIALYAAFGLDAVVVGTAASLVVAAALVAAIPTTRPTAGPADAAQRSGAGTALRELVEGARYAASCRTLRRLGVSATIAGFGHGALVVSIVPFLREGVGLSAGAYALALALASASGVLTNVVLIGRWSSVEPLRLYVRSVPWVGPVLIVMALAAGHPAVSVAMLVIHGAVSIMPGAPATTLLQRHTPSALQGRVFALSELVTHVALLGGTLLAGTVATVWGPVAAMGMVGAVYAVWGIAGLVMFRRIEQSVVLPTMGALRSAPAMP